MEYGEFSSSSTCVSGINVTSAGVVSASFIWPGVAISNTKGELTVDPQLLSETLFGLWISKGELTLESLIWGVDKSRHSNIPCDQMIESTINRSAKSTGGIIGKTKDASASKR